MTGNSAPPDYDLAERITLTEPAQVKAISHPLRTAILGLLHERAATVTELAAALERPKSTVAHHVKVLAEAGLVQTVRTRRVRAIEERSYGRTARMFYVSAERSPDSDRLPPDFNDFEVAARESALAYESGKLWGFIRHARITEAQASQFWERMAELVTEFDRLPRSGDTMYGFAVGVYPTEYPTLPSHDDKDAARPINPGHDQRARLSPPRRAARPSGDDGSPLADFELLIDPPWLRIRRPPGRGDDNAWPA